MGIVRRIFAWLLLAGLLSAAPAVLFACPGAACCRGMHSGCAGAGIARPCCAAAQLAIEPLPVPPAGVQPVAPASFLYARPVGLRPADGIATARIVQTALAASPPPAAPGASNLPLLI
jgi:hypothetical protein